MFTITVVLSLSITDTLTVYLLYVRFFFQAEDGIRDAPLVTGVQTCALPIFSVAAVALLPPTLIASIYGMNFEHMPELDWPFGYPLALLLMVASAVVPYLYFKRRGWL